jgi:AraC family transcriptional regulator, arabinose operon regulatory protein
MGAPVTALRRNQMSARKKLPFDPRVARFEEETKSFEEAIFHFLSLEDRRRWMRPDLFSDLTVFQVGYFKKARGHAVERGSLDEAILIYCVAGKGEYSQRSTTWTVLPGDLLYCAPNTHHIYKSDEKDPWTIHWMHVSGPRMALYRKLIGFSQTVPIVKLGMHIDIIELFRSLYDLYTPINDETHLTAIYACAHHILAAMALAQRPSSASPQWEREIQTVIGFMEQSVDKKMRLDDFSDYLGLSRFHFSRRFRSITGMPPMKYFMHLKIKKACFLLQSTSLKVKAISHDLGFENEYYFSRCFKTCVGCSPQHYCKVP